MSSYFFLGSANAFVKECSTCDKQYIGTRSREESEKIFSKDFSSNSRTTDGFHGVCLPCHYMKRRQERYNITGQQFKDMFQEQQGKCALCKIEILIRSEVGNPRRACIDHDHTTNEIRSLLCNDCNVMLGAYERVRDRLLVKVQLFEAYIRGWAN